MNCSRCGFGIPEDKRDNDTDTATCPRCGAVHSRTQFDYRKRLHDFLLAKAGPQLEMSLWDNGERRLRTRLRPNPLREWLVWIILSAMLLGTFLFCRYSSSYAKPALLLAFCIFLAADALLSCFEKLEIVIDGEEGRWRRKRLLPRKWITFRCAPDTRFVPLWRPISSFSDNSLLASIEVQNKGAAPEKRKLPCYNANKEFGILIMAFLEHSRLAGLDEREAAVHSEGCGDCLWLSGIVPVVPYGPWHFRSGFFRFLLIFFFPFAVRYAAEYVDGERYSLYGLRSEVFRTFFSDGQKCLSAIDSPPRNIGISYRWHKDWVKDRISLLLNLKDRLTQAVRNGDRQTESEIRGELMRLRNELTATWVDVRDFPHKLVAELACRMSDYDPLRDAGKSDKLDALFRSAVDDFDRFDCRRRDHRIKEEDFVAKLSSASNTVELMRAIHGLDENDQTNRLFEIARNWSVLVDMTAAHPRDRLLMMISANIDPSVLPIKWNGRTHVEFEFSALAGIDASEFGGSTDAVTLHPHSQRGGCVYTTARCGKHTLDKLDSIFDGKSYSFSENAYFLTPVGKVWPRRHLPISDAEGAKRVECPQDSFPER